MFTIQKVDHFPEISRQGRVSSELQMIIDALRDSAANNERFCIDGIEKGNSYNSMQQRIRTQAKKLNLRVVIRHDAFESKLYFRAFNESETTNTLNVETSVKASSVKGVKTAKVKETVDN